MPDSPETGYAFWIDPDSSFKITYSLPVFHEVDFYVSEGFRRIPHGGVELGGLLFGRRDGNSARIEAFRNIESEHASGPSFVPSERDLKMLEQQLAVAKSDPDLADLEPLGWFVAHTRSDLEMNDREVALFDRFLPGPGKFTVLAKPERFQPTRFAFLLRTEDGQIQRDGRDRAVILPLPGRASASGGEPVPSIPAPRMEPAPVPNKASQERAIPPERSQPVSARPMRRDEFEEEAPRLPPRPARAVAEVSSPRQTEIAPIPALPPLPRRTPRTDFAGTEVLARPDRVPQRDTERDRRMPAALRLLIVLVIAAALGCAAGYWAYIQLPSATIPLNIQPRGSALLVSWPPGQTRGAAYATIRIDDGAPIPLSDRDKAAGQTTIAASGSEVKVELTVQHWMRQSRGIVRFVTAAVPVPAS
jgi:hypothetical protein